MASEKHIKVVYGGFMTDEQFIDVLRKLHNYCESYRKKGDGCTGCKFLCLDEYGKCQFRILAYLIHRPPVSWNMEEIERIIRL